MNKLNIPIDAALTHEERRELSRLDKRICDGTATKAQLVRAIHLLLFAAKQRSRSVRTNETKMLLEQELALIEDRLGDPDLSNEERAHWEEVHNDVQNELQETTQ